MVRLLRDRPVAGIKWGLERTRFMLAELGDPQRSFRTVHVGGTNGKGSVCLVAAALLSAAGRRTGAYLSPHTVRFAERVRVPPDGREAPPELLETCAERVRPLADRADASRFEAITTLGFLALAEVGVEAASVEVGLGGRLDATNVLRPEVVAVVTVARDHGEFLGDSVEEVAGEVGGILKPGTPVVIGRVPDGARAVLADRAREVDARVVRLGEEGRVEGVEVDSDGGTRFRYRSTRWPEGIPLRVPLAGGHQAYNAAVALLSMEAADVPVGEEDARRALARVRHPGRMQLVRRRGLWVLDVAHNPEAVEAVLDGLEAVGAPRPRVGVVSILRDKPWRRMLSRLAGELDKIVATLSPSSEPGRRWSLQDVASGSTAAVERIPGVEEALRRGRELAGDGTVVVTGTTGLVGDALRRLRADA